MEKIRKVASPGWSGHSSKEPIIHSVSYLIPPPFKNCILKIKDVIPIAELPGDKIEIEDYSKNNEVNKPIKKKDKW